MNDALIQRLDAIDAKLDRIDRRGQIVENMVDEMTPVVREVIRGSSEQLADLEARGYFAVGRELAALADRVVSSYGPEEVHLLAEQIVSILDTVRNLTQPDVLHVVNDATDVIHDAARVKPIGPMGALKATRDEDVQRGLGIALEVLRHLGQHHDGQVAPARRAQKTSSQAAEKARAKPAANRGRVGQDRPAAACEIPRPQTDPDTIEAVEWNGHQFDGDGFLLDPGAWSEALGGQIAEALGVSMSEDHWTVVKWARAEFLSGAASPNVRRVANGSGVGTRRIYELFPKSPGKTTARIAGIPKPVGCI